VVVVEDAVDVVDAGAAGEVVAATEEAVAKNFPVVSCKSSEF